MPREDSALLQVDRAADDVYTNILKLQDSAVDQETHELLQEAAKQMYAVMVTLGKARKYAQAKGGAENVRGLAAELHQKEP